MNWTPHPILKPPTKEQIVALTTNADWSDNSDGFRKLVELWETHEAAIENAERDPYNYGIKFPAWNEAYEQAKKWYEVLCFGGNGSSKSQFGAWMVVDALLNNPGAKIYCFAQDDSASKQIQQRYIYNMLPPQYKDGHNTTKGGYIKYTHKNGFTDNSFILDAGDGGDPRECYFFKYSQYQANKAKFEGYEYGSRHAKAPNLGAWLDEYLENGELYNTLLYRIPRRGAFILTTFTPIFGLTPFVADKIKGSTVTKTIATNPRVMNYDKGEPQTVEYVREKRNNKGDKAGVGMVYFPSEQNPWSGFDSMISLHSHKSLNERLTRFHGIPAEMRKALLPQFSTMVNVLGGEPNEYGMSFPDISDKNKFTCYQIVDPAGRRNYVSIWLGVNKDGEVYVRREWPDLATYGEWALYSDPHWKKGPASNKLGYDVEGYVNLFREIEKEIGIDVFARIGDSRYFAAENDDNIDRFTQFADKGMEFEPSDGRKEDLGVTALDDWFHYNSDKPVDSANRPLFYVHESCGNLIDALMNYRASGIYDEALKDFFDLIRYARMAEGGDGVRYYKPDVFKNNYKQKTWGY
jgi:hypothetical protein